MSEQKRERGIKVLVNRAICIEEDGVLVKHPKGSIVIIPKELVSHFGTAVTRDLPEGEE